MASGFCYLNTFFCFFSGGKYLREQIMRVPILPQACSHLYAKFPRLSVLDHLVVHVAVIVHHESTDIHKKRSIEHVRPKLPATKKE